jgi:hypothetical protein
MVTVAMAFPDGRGGQAGRCRHTSGTHLLKLADAKRLEKFWIRTFPRMNHNYLLAHSQQMQYSAYRRAGLPIGSGVTEAGCKVVFTQRFKQSGMTWGREGGAVILRLRLAVLSGVWGEVYRQFLDHQPLVSLATPLARSPRSDEKAA